MNVGIVGLGLIGGSMAKSIKNKTLHTVLGIDLNPETMSLARLYGAIDGVLTDDNLRECDLILLAVRPGAAVEWMENHGQHIAKTTLWWTCAESSGMVAKCHPWHSAGVFHTSAAIPWPDGRGGASPPPRKTSSQALP